MLTLRLLKIACPVALACVLSEPPMAEAATLSSIQFNTASANSLPLGTIQDIKIGFSGAAPTATITRSTTATVNGTVFTDQAFVEVDIEAMRARSSLAATAGPAAASYLSQVTAVTQDGFRIDSALYHGQIARVEYTLDVSGFVEPFIDAGAGTLAGAFSTWRLSSGCLDITQCAQTAYTGGASYNGGQLLPNGHDTGLLSFVLEIAFGTKIDLITALDLTNQLLFGDLKTGEGVEGVAGTVTADFSHTVVWGGIRSVSLLDGTVVADWTSTSGSGFDYGSASVVPVPAAVWLFGSAVAGLAALRRRR